MIAVNMEVIRPMDSVTAKPRTGPVPNTSSSSAAISVVTFESMIVVNARR